MSNTIGCQCGKQFKIDRVLHTVVTSAIDAGFVHRAVDGGASLFCIECGAEIGIAPLDEIFCEFKLYPKVAVITGSTTHGHLTGVDNG